MLRADTKEIFLKYYLDGMEIRYWSNEVALPKGVRLLGIRRVPSETNKNFGRAFLKGRG